MNWQLILGYIVLFFVVLFFVHGLLHVIFGLLTSTIKRIFGLGLSSVYPSLMETLSTSICSVLAMAYIWRWIYGIYPSFLFFFLIFLASVLAGLDEKRLNEIAKRQLAADMWASILVGIYFLVFEQFSWY